VKPSQPSKEQQILFDLLKGKVPSNLEGVNTNALFELFRRHRLFPLAPVLFPMLEEEERQRWKQAVQVRTLRSMQQLALCNRFTEAFQKEGILAMPFKGPVLAHMLFGDLGERHSSDLDILIRDPDIQRIIRLAGEEGFELLYPKKGLSARQWRYYLKYKKDIGLVHRESGILVELHHGFENYLGLTSAHMDRFVRETETVRIGDLRFTTMNRHMTFLYLVMHGGVHQYRRLFWLRDVATALEKWELDHGSVLADARNMGIGRLLGISLMLAGELFGTGIPEEYRAYLDRNSAILVKLRQTAYGFILGPEFPDRRGKLRHHRFMLRLKPELSHYFRTVREIVNRFYIGKFLGGH
jgi:hypothetical protein